MNALLNSIFSINLNIHTTLKEDGVYIFLSEKEK